VSVNIRRDDDKPNVVYRRPVMSYDWLACGT